MSHKLLQLVSPRDHRTALVNRVGKTSGADGLSVLFDGRTISVGDYLARFPATEFVTCERTDDLSPKLRMARDRSSTLDFTLMLLNPDYSAQLKCKIAKVLDDLLALDANREYVLDILLSHPLPEGTDFESAKMASIADGQTHRLISTLEESQERVTFAFNAWLAIRKNPMVVQIGEERARGKLILSGIVRQSVIELTTQSYFTRRSGGVLIGSADYLDPRITQAFLNEYRRYLPEGQIMDSSKDRLSNQQRERPEPEVIGRPISQQHRGRRLFADNAQERAVTEVESIAKLFLEEKDATARQYRDELVTRQSVEADQSHVVKSLCNVASKCTTGGRYDIAAECLQIAVQFERGVDSRLFVQMGNLFKDLNKFEEATSCIAKAEQLAEDLTERDIINRELARLLAAQGNYDQALKAFRKLSDIDTAPESQTSMATLLRKMGNVTEARHIYTRVWQHHGTHQSFAGLAELNRQTGRLGKAIAKYNRLLAKQEIDDRSLKIYRMALSSLHRVMGRLDDAKTILEELQAEYPTDPLIQLEMAKIFRLSGHLEQADELYHLSFGKLQETDRLAVELYETAMMQAGTRPTQPVEPIKVLPEFQSLANCNMLLRRILYNDRSSMPSFPYTIQSPYKVHADFEAVLRYHATLLLRSDVDPVGDVRVNRIRKRGIMDLRSAVRALDQREFDLALRFEQQVCFRVA